MYIAGYVPAMLVGRPVTLLLIGFVIVAPRGIVGLVQDFMREGAAQGGAPTWRSRLAAFANMRPGAR